ncbi:hypothetical protein JOM56_009362 [Amanita muscaria]
MPPPASPPHTGQVERGSQRPRPSSHRHEISTTTSPPLPPRRQKTPAPTPPPLPPRRRESPAPTPPPLPPQRRESPAPTPPPVPPRRRGPGSAPSALNLNEPAASTHYPQRQTLSQYWAPPDTQVSTGHVLPHPASPPHTGQVGKGPRQPRPPPHRLSCKDRCVVLVRLPTSCIANHYYCTI